MKSEIIAVAMIVFIILSGCSNTPKWKHERTIQFEDIAPLGIAKHGDFLWISDSDNNKVVKIDLSGKILETYENFERPMHIDMDGDKVFVPEYGADTITIINGDNRTYLSIQNELDAPAGIDVNGQDYAIADFYNHRIVYHTNGKDMTFGKKGKVNGTFHYPTDIQFANNLIYVADAYNNRAQVFDKKGKFKQSIGSEDGMNAATGIYVTDQSIFVTDFENSRVLIYDLNGELLQTIDAHFDKPTDVIADDNKFYVTNYKSKSIAVFTTK